MLSMRIVGLLDKFNSVTQSGFIKGRYIMENLITSWEAMHEAKADNQNVAMVLLDFEKAYDRIEWSFVGGMLQAFGFPSYFCKWIDILFKDSSTIVEINGDMSEAIPLRRSIRQGFPIAPTMFVIVANALYYILRALELGPSIKGLTLPNVDGLINAQFVDDTALFIALFEDNFDNAMERL
ncbi:secreted RxLR effector protein 78-like [Cryptomeria japonica]|uniref:secreted RxLR effector protein 78-like n=1 Tax=Cryptomeria japonica TaxID=3369 RepID=UPI0027DA8A49|nr:secreted RxLR effector protein 78-like [Cryptomeria japonica]